MACPGGAFQLKYTKEEWHILSSIAGGDDKISMWLNSRLHKFCREEFENITIFSMNETMCRGFCIPPEILPYINHLAERFKQRPATIVKRFITEPYLLPRLNVNELLAK